MNAEQVQVFHRKILDPSTRGPVGFDYFDNMSVLGRAFGTQPDEQAELSVRTVS
jgi:hypothetical protein